MHVTVETKHVEEHVDRQHRVSTQMEQAGFQFLLLDLVAFKERGFHIDEVECLFVLALLGEHFQVQANEFAINLEVGLLHQLEQEQIGNVEDFGLELEGETDQVHGLYGPLRVDVFGVDLVQVQALVLLLQKLAFSHVGEK